MTRRVKPDQNFVQAQAKRLREILQLRARPSNADLAYAVEKLDKMKDERLRDIFLTAIGWGDDERAEIETFLAIAIEVMRQTNVSKLRAAATTVELRYYMKDKQDEQVQTTSG